jgi:hypothetical protein
LADEALGVPPIPPGVFGTNCLFSTRWRQGSPVKYIVLRNLEAKFMKTENLLDLFAAPEQGETPRVWTQYTTHRDRIAD